MSKKAGSSSVQKGNVLERAVKAIETAILRQSPVYSEKTFRIEHKKRIKTRDGVPHEIDIWVTVEIAPGYPAATYVFECKNWTNKVKKEGVSAFSDKIAAVHAQKGFLVARSLTRGALARLNSDQQMERLQAQELSLDEVPERITMFYAVSADLIEQDCAIECARDRQQAEGATEVVQLGTAVFTVEGQPRDLETYVKNWIAEAAKTCPTLEGEHTFEDTRIFPRGAATLDGRDIEEMKVTGKVRVRWTPGVVTSRFEVAARGRVFQCTAALPNGGQVVMEEVRLYQNG